MIEYSYLEEIPDRDLVGRITRVEPLGLPPYGRVSIEVDCVDVRSGVTAVARHIQEGSDINEFAIVRLLTTKRRFQELVGVAPFKGTWLHLRIGPNDGVRRPIIYHSQLRDNGYTEQSKGRLFECDRLFSEFESDPDPAALGAAVSDYIKFARAIKAASSFPLEAIASRGSVKLLLQRCAVIDHIVVRDVGQANFITMFDAGDRTVAHFDVGWPLSFNGRTVPAKCNVGADSALILLSHWDFDHLHGFYRFPHLQDCNWIAPVQGLSPGKARIARRLARNNRLIGWSGGSIGAGPLMLIDCSGGHPLNDTGNALTVKLPDKRTVLCAGDASYSAIPSSAGSDFLVVTHHGARFDGVVPPPRSPGSLAVVSVGKYNVYQHPRPDAVDEHRRNGWRIQFTGEFEGHARSDRRIG